MEGLYCGIIIISFIMLMPCLYISMCKCGCQVGGYMYATCMSKERLVVCLYDSFFMVTLTCLGMHRFIFFFICCILFFLFH